MLLGSWADVEGSPGDSQNTLWFMGWSMLFSALVLKEYLKSPSPLFPSIISMQPREDVKGRRRGVTPIPKTWSAVFMCYFLPAGLLEGTSETQVPLRRRKGWPPTPRVCRVLAGRWDTHRLHSGSTLYFFSLGSSFPPWALNLISKPKGLPQLSSESQQHGFPLLKHFSPTLLHYYPTSQVHLCSAQDKTLLSKKIRSVLVFRPNWLQLNLENQKWIEQH